MRFSVLPPSYSLVAMESLLVRDVPFFSTMVIFTTASDPSSFRLSATLSMISLGVGPALAIGAAPTRPTPMAVARAKVAIRREMWAFFMFDGSSEDRAQGKHPSYVLAPGILPGRETKGPAGTGGHGSRSRTSRDRKCEVAQ